MDDAQLIQQFCDGQTGAFNGLVDRWQHRIHRVAFRYFNSYDEAVEITQKTFISVYKKLDTLENHQKFKTWIYRIVNNLCKDEIKRAGRRRSAPLHAVKNELGTKTKVHDPENIIHQKQLGILLQKALQELSPEQRMVVIMKEYEELKFREIAQALQTPEGTVKSRLYTGLTKLRKTFDQWNINKEALYYE